MALGEVPGEARAGGGACVQKAVGRVNLNTGTAEGYQGSEVAPRRASPAGAGSWLSTPWPRVPGTGLAAARLQIFNLMKFDSYARFVKSPLYRECLLAEAEGRPLRAPGCSPVGSPNTARKVLAPGAGRRATRGGGSPGMRVGLDFASVSPCAAHRNRS